MAGSDLSPRTDSKALAVAVIEGDWVAAWENSNYLAVVRDLAGRIVAVNRSFARKFGKAAAAWHGHEFALLCYPQDKRRWLEQVSLLLDVPHRIEHETRWLTAQGARWIAWEETSILDPQGNPVLFRAVGRDITRERNAADHACMLARTVEQSPVGIMISDLEGRPKYANSSFVQATGYNAEELETLEPSILRMAHDSEEAYRAFLVRVREGNDWNGEFRLVRKDGGALWQRLHVSTLRNPQGEISQLLCLQEDITEQKRLESQLRQSQKMESLGLLAGGIAHDFNNMLAIINGYAEVLLGRPSIQQDEATRRCMREIHGAAQRAVGLVQRILTFSRKTEVKVIPIKLNKLLRELGALLAETFPRTITFEFDLEDGLPDLVADQNQLQQVVMNLCVNARDAMPRGGRVILQTRLCEGASLPEGNPALRYLRLQISDTGVGIPPAILQRIFEPFFTTKQDSGGTGLGLAMVYGIVQSHRGLIDVRSSPGEGSCFTLHFPLEAGAEAGGPAVQPSAVFAGFPMGTESILVAEDEVSLRNLLCNVLGPCGYTVRTAPDGREALAAIRDPNLALDAIILDLNMPNVHGTEVFRELRQLRPGVKVLIVSGNISPEVQSALVAMGQKDFILKPYRLEDLCGRLRRLLDGA